MPAKDAQDLVQINKSDDVSKNFNSDAELNQPSQITIIEESDIKTVLSRNQIKKQEKWMRRKERQRQARKEEKEKKKRNKQKLAQAIIDAGGSKEEVSIRLRRQRYTLMKDSTNRFRIVIDMDFADYMTDSEMSKAVQQVGRIYTINRYSGCPAQLYITSLFGKLRDKFSSVNTGYINWDANFSESDFIGTLSTCNPIEGDNQDQKDIKSNIIYLSGDSDTDLPDLDQILSEKSTIFVIGGIVDHNRHKGLCYSKAKNLGIRTARLPISENLTLNQRHILSTVTVFEILLKVLGSNLSWNEALTSSIPKRKIACNEPKTIFNTSIDTDSLQQIHKSEDS